MSAAWVIYDGDQRRVLAARDAEGSAAMHWGTTEDGQFMFGSDPIDLTDCNPTATPFPAGVPTLPCNALPCRGAGKPDLRSWSLCNSSNVN